MPGIAGFLTRNADPENASVLEQMLGCMKHEPSYQSQQIVLPENGGWTGTMARLQVQHLAWNADRSLGILIYGEFRIVDASLSAKKESPLQNLLSEYEKHGINALLRLNGWFSGLIFDTRSGKTVLFNDRYGLGRVYCHEDKDRLFFSSEAKAILSVQPDTRQFDPRGLGEWLSCGCVLQNRTLFSGITLLPPGSAWCFTRDAELTKSSYFNPADWENQPELSAPDYVAQLIETFPRILRSYVDSTHVGMSLTGGLDGRMIMAWSSMKPGELPCYTFNGPVRDCADVKIARQVARVCGQKHQDIPIAEDFFSRFGSLAAQSVYVTDGAMDVTGAAELYMNEKARQIAPIRLTGNYGSEILRRYVAFRTKPINGALFHSDVVASSRQAHETYAQEAAGNRLSFIAFKQVPWHHHSRFAVEQSLLTLRSPYLDNELVSLVFRAPKELTTTLDSSLKLIAAGNPELARIPTDRGITYPAGKMMNRIAREYHEFMAKAEYAYDYGMPDRLAKIDRYLRPFHFEKLFLGRQKFCHFRSWYQDQLSGFVREILLDRNACNRAYLNSSALEPLVEGHIKGIHNRTTEIHKLLTLELLQKQLFESRKWEEGKRTIGP
jgi:Asparagine synthase (glutamine-hydrolyzing)